MTTATASTTIGDARWARSDRTDRWVYRVASALTVVPIVVAVVRDGLDGWQPTWDAAIATVRIRDVLGGHVPLIGMAASPGGGGDELYSQPGSLLFLLLALPERLFGTTWGLLVGIAAIDVAAVLAALWLIRRCVGERGALLAAVGVSSLLWSLGSEIVIDVNPGQVGILVFFTFLVAAWAVLDGDGPAIWVFAAAGNLLFLTHLRFALVVPVVAVFTVVAWVVRVAIPRWKGAPEPGRSARYRPHVIAAVAITVAAWVPVLWDQFAGSGNLGKLLAAVTTDGGAGASSGGPLGALGAVLSVTAVPPLWLPPSFSRPPFDVVGGGQPLALRVICGVVLLVWFVALSRWAYRRRRRTLGSGLAVAFVAWWTMVAAWMLNPSADKLPVKYFWELWPLALFVWFVLVVGTVDAVQSSGRRLPVHRGAVSAVALVVLVASTVAASPRRNNCGGRCSSMRDELVPVMRSARDTVAAMDLGAGPVLVDAPMDWSRQPLPAVLRGLQDQGIEFRIAPGADVQQYGSDRAETDPPTSTRELLVSTSGEVPAGARLVGTFRTPAFVDDEHYRELDTRFRRWHTVARDDPGVTDRRRLLDRPHDAVYRAFVELFVLRARQDHGPGPFAEVVTNLERVGVLPREGLFDVPGMTTEEVTLWALETTRRDSGTYFLYERRLPEPG